MRMNVTKGTRKTAGSPSGQVKTRNMVRISSSDLFRIRTSQTKQILSLFNAFYKTLRLHPNHPDTHKKLYLLLNPRSFWLSSKRFRQSDLKKLYKSFKDKNDPAGRFLLAVALLFKAQSYTDLSGEEVKMTERGLMNRDAGPSEDSATAPYEFYYRAEFFRLTGRANLALNAYEQCYHMTNDPYVLLRKIRCYFFEAWHSLLLKNSWEALQMFGEGVLETDRAETEFKRLKKRGLLSEDQAASVLSVLNALLFEFVFGEETLIFDYLFRKVFTSANFGELIFSLQVAIRLIKRMHIVSELWDKSKLQSEVKAWKRSSSEVLDPVFNRFRMSLPVLAALLRPRRMIFHVLFWALFLKTLGKSYKEEPKNLLGLHSQLDWYVKSGQSLPSIINTLKDYKVSLERNLESVRPELVERTVLIIYEESAEEIKRVLAFLEELDKYKKLEEITKEKAIELLAILRPLSHPESTIAYSVFNVYREELERAVFSELERLQKHTVPESKPPKPFVRMWTKDAPSDRFSITADEKKDIIKNPNNYNYQLIVIKEKTRTMAFINGEKVIPPRKLMYRILIYALKHQGSAGTAWNLAKHLWDVKEAEKLKDLKEMAKALQLQPRIQKAKMQAKLGIHKVEVERVSKLTRRRMEDLNNRFLSKIPVKLKANSAGEYEFNPELNYCLMEEEA